MNNLFDYATKELSQDAFLRWFLESNIDDSGKKLISEFTGLDFHKISNIHTEAQFKRIDILAEFTYGNEKCVLIIEDKVNSNQHDNQLKRYSNFVKEKYKNAKQFFIYYKPRFLTDEEPQNFFIQNEWLGFGIDKIHNFFKNYLKHKNDILRSYALFIDSLYKKLISISDKPIIEWDYIDALSFFTNSVEKIFRKYHNGEKLSESKIYQGHYASYKMYYTFENKQLYRKVYPLIEFVFRKNKNRIDVQAHICFRNNDVWNWKWKEEVNEYSNNEEFLLRLIKAFIDSGFKKWGNIENSKTQTFAICRIAKEQSRENLEKEIESIIKSFVNGFEEFESHFICDNR